MSPQPWRHHPPPWWPEGEPWGPRRAAAWRRRRARFLGRFALIFSVVWLLSSLGAASLFTRFTRAPGGAEPIAIAVLVLAALAFVAVFRRVGSPIGDLVGAAHRFADGDFATRVPEHGPPPVRAVAAAFNDMAGRLARQERQRRELMADIAHELRTPLSVVQGRLEGLIDGVYPRDTPQLESLLEETRVLARLVEDVRTLANAESGVLTIHREPTDVGMLIRDAAEAIREEAAAAGVAVHLHDETAGQLVEVDSVRIRQVVVNLLANAVRHGRSGGSVDVTARLAERALAIDVADNGPGIPADELPRVFDRFHKGRSSSGSGLGLTIARTLVQAHGGSIHAESAVGAGTTIRCTVPLG
jgi:two-component system OmpR family sensor kinase/two-component system sensor histidine kinase BaeS